MVVFGWLYERLSVKGFLWPGGSGPKPAASQRSWGIVGLVIRGNVPHNAAGLFRFQGGAHLRK